MAAEVFGLAGLGGEGCKTVSEVAEDLRQIERLRMKGFVGHEVGQAVGEFREVVRGDRPPFDCGPAKHDCDVATIAVQG